MQIVSRRFKRNLLVLICVLIGTMMFYRGVLNIAFYPGNLERMLLGPVFFGGVAGIYLMYRGYRIGFWVFTFLNFFVGYWFIFILEDVWHHHVLPHIVFSAVFVPFYFDMKPTGLWRRIQAHLGSFASRLLDSPVVVSVIARIPKVEAFVNRLAIDRIVSQVRARPHPYSTRHDYVSWAGLTNRTWSARHLPPADRDLDRLPPAEEVAKLFLRSPDDHRLSDKSTCLFPAFAQYLTDGFIRTSSDEADPDKLKRNTSNHDIDMCPLYGRTEEQTRQLRVSDPGRDGRGRLKSQSIRGEEYPPFLFRDGAIDRQFDKLDLPLGLTKLQEAIDSGDEQMSKIAAARRDALFAVGGDRVNGSPQVAMVNTLFLREHNRLADEIARRYPDFDDDRVFETARNIVIVEFIKIVVEDYINHISPTLFRLRADPKVAWKANWNRTNWITTEFSLLYRWHALVPDRITWGGTEYPVEFTFFNNLPLLAAGVLQGCRDMGSQAAGCMGPFNTNAHLAHVEVSSILQDRFCRLAPYADYREYLGLGRPRSMKDISSSEEAVAFLEKCYSSVEDVDFYVGLFAEDRVKNSPLPMSILRMVAIDAFSQALTNPLLSEHVFNPQTFTEYGWDQIRTTSTLADIIRRNVEGARVDEPFAMTQPGWRRE